MSKALLSRPVPVGLLVAPSSRPKSTAIPDIVPRTPRSDPAVWLGPALVGAAVGLLLLAAAGATAAALQPVSQTITETAYVPPAEPDPPAISVPEPDPDPVPVEPGEVRPTPAGLVAAGFSPAAPPVEPAQPACDRFGTAVEFVRSPS